LFRILLTISLEENMKMTDCYFAKKDWRSCKTEVRSSSQFSDCSAYHVGENVHEIISGLETA
jgi:hypothetical protein